jgi:predicted Fe-Mo cluster-binding NifX family protein
MTEAISLFHVEEKSLKELKGKVKSNAVSKRTLVRFIDNYDDLITQSKVITRVSDRLQSKLNKAKDQIAEQNAIISSKNSLLENTIDQLIKAQVGKKALTIILVAAIILFVAEEILLEEAIKTYISIPYMGLIVKLFLALVLKSFESTIEKFFVKKEHSKIVDGSQWKGIDTYSEHQSAFKPQESITHSI